MLPSYSRPRSAAPGTQARFTAAILVLCALCTLELMFLRGKQLENRDLQTALESSSFKFSELQVSNDQDKLDLTKMISSLEAATTATTELEAKVQALQVGTALAIYSEQREEIQVLVFNLTIVPLGNCCCGKAMSMHVTWRRSERREIKSRLQHYCVALLSLSFL